MFILHILKIRMSSLTYGLMIILLTGSKIVSANDLISPKSFSEKDISILKSSVEQDESLNKLTKRSIPTPQFNQLNYDYGYNPRVPQPAAAVQLSPYLIFPSWQPQGYQINSPVYQDSRPYYAPAWNTFERLPVNYQPQPIYFDVGYPVDNPPRGNPSAGRNCQPQPCSNPAVNTYDKWGEMGEAPIWGNIPMITPTRPTRRPGQGPVTQPPLIHNAHDTDVELTTPSSVKQPSKCVWAIVSCCSASSNKVSYGCFEQQGCSGAFWDSNPCETEFARAAIANVMKYYQSK